MTGAELINVIGIPSLLAAFFYIGKKLNILDSLKHDMDTVIKPDLKDVRERVITLEEKVTSLDKRTSVLERNTAMLGRRADSLEQRTAVVEVRLDTLGSEVSSLSSRMDGLFGGHSPLNFTIKGKRYLVKSGLKSYIDSNQRQLIKQLQSKEHIPTPYDAQQLAFAFFGRYEFPEKVNNQLKTFAYDAGISMGSVRQIAGLYLRDLYLAGHNTAADKPADRV